MRLQFFDDPLTHYNQVRLAAIFHFEHAVVNEVWVVHVLLEEVQAVFSLLSPDINVLEKVRWDLSQLLEPIFNMLNISFQNCFLLLLTYFQLSLNLNKFGFQIFF